MTVAIIILLIFMVTGWAVFRKPSPSAEWKEDPSYTSSPDNMAEPIISYSLYALDQRSGRRLDMQSPKEFPNQFGIVKGQAIELHWNVLNADWISIEGVGFVQAIGKKEFYPSSGTKYKMIAKNRAHSIEQEFFVRVFPLPLLEKLLVPVPEFQTIRFQLFSSPVPAVEKFQPLNFPSFQLPSVIGIQKENRAEKPQAIVFDGSNISRIKTDPDWSIYGAFKMKLFNRMEKVFKDNNKLKDVVQMIRKQYE